MGKHLTRDKLNTLVMVKNTNQNDKHVSKIYE